VDETDRAIQWLLDNRMSLLELGARTLATTGAWEFQSVAGRLESSLDRQTRELNVVAVTRAGYLRAEIYVPYVDQDPAGQDSELRLQLAAGLTTVFALDDPAWLASLPDPHGVPDEEMVLIVPWHRIADDLRRTAGKELTLQFSREDDGWWDVYIDIDQERNGSFGRNFSDHPEEFLADLADYLCDSYLHVEVWGGWPLCPRHTAHPLNAELADSGVAVWRCPQGGFEQAIGHLEATG
jgi:hypothetical protein